MIVMTTKCILLRIWVDSIVENVPYLFPPGKIQFSGKGIDVCHAYQLRPPNPLRLADAARDTHFYEQIPKPFDLPGLWSGRRIIGEIAIQHFVF